MHGSTQVAGHPGGRLVWLATATAALGIALLARGQADYADRIAPTWTPGLGGLVAIVCATVVRHRKATCVAATVLLLPSAIAGIFHVMRALGAIPLPVDWLALVVSVGAALTVWTAWGLGDPLRGPGGRPLDTPRWVVGVGVLAAMAYPVLKTTWLAGSRWLAPDGAGSAVDAAYVVPVALALLGLSATVVALRWWDRPAPAWAHNAAVVGGLALMGLGVSGVNATLTTATAEGPLLGLVVYGSWALWGLATLGVAGRLSSHRVAGGRSAEPPRSVSPAALDRE